MFDNGIRHDRVDWIRDGTMHALAYPRAAAAEFAAQPAAPGRQPAAHRRYRRPRRDGRRDGTRTAAHHALVSPRGRPGESADDRTDPRRGVPGRGRAGPGAVDNFRFNECPLDLLGRVTEAGVSEVTLPREWGDWFTRAAMPRCGSRTFTCRRSARRNNATMRDPLNGELGRLVALAPPEHGRINALVRQTCAKTLSLPPLPTELVVDGPADEAESVAVDSPNSSVSTCHPSATTCEAGSHRRWVEPRSPPWF